MRDDIHERERRLAEREQALAEARAEADRLLAEATAARDRARKLATRFVRRLKRRHAAERLALDAERQKFAEQAAQFDALRSEFHTTAAVARDRLRDAWAAVESQQQRAAGEWGEASRYFAEQVAALDARAAELDAREKAAGQRLAQGEAEVAGLREEAAALEVRVRHARAALAELERRRDRARAELLHTELPGDIIPAPDADDLAHRELLLMREKGAVAALRSSLELESADLDDRRRLAAEQLAQLAEARVRWHSAERQTVVEMEELARALGHREQALDARESRLIRADARRREDAHDLWRLRLRLEAWQTKLTAAELRGHTGRADSPASEELAALRAEVERLAGVVMEMESPDPELPWAGAETQADSRKVPRFDARAA